MVATKSFLAAILASAPAVFVRAQTTGPSTDAKCGAGFDWMLNNQRQTPCLVAAYLAASCRADNTFNIGALNGTGAEYQRPSSTLNSPCICNTVFYDLISGCAICQNGLADVFSPWISGCPTNEVTLGKYPQPVPSGTSIPAWAYYDPTVSGRFNATAAQQLLNQGGGGKKSSTPIGAIVGGVVGGLALIAIIGGVIFYFVRKNKNAKGPVGPQDPTYHTQQPPFPQQQSPYQQPGAFPAPMSPQMSGYNQFAPSPYSQPGGVAPYNPDDPATFPVTPAPSAGPYPVSPNGGYNGPLPSSPYNGPVHMSPQPTGQPGGVYHSPYPQV